MKVTKDIMYEVLVNNNYGGIVYERNDLASAMEVYDKFKDNPLVKEIVVQKVERLVVKRLFDGKESNY